MLTFAMIKPDAVRLRFFGSIISKIESLTDLSIVELMLMRLTEAQVRQFYAEHDGKPFFEPLVEFSTSGPFVCIVLKGENAVDRWRELMGATNPQQAKPGTLRHEFGFGMPNNAVHGSDSEQSAEREIALFRSW